MSQVQEDFSATLENALKISMEPILELELMKRKEYLNVEEVSMVFNLNVASLNAQRSRRIGPPYVKHGNRVLYNTQEVRDYLQARKVRTLD